MTFVVPLFLWVSPTFPPTRAGHDNVFQRKVIFFDELPWLDTHRSGLLSHLSYFWNDWAVKNGVIEVIGGSAASWMMNKVIYHHGGLHNRTDYLIQLQSFALTEVKEYFRKNNIKLDEYQIIQLYMAIGGVPHYLKQIRGGGDGRPKYSTDLLQYYGSITQ